MIVKVDNDVIQKIGRKRKEKPNVKPKIKINKINKDQLKCVTWISNQTRRNQQKKIKTRSNDTQL
jgi:hypothetical protein